MKPLTSDLQLKRLRLSGFKSIELCDLELGGLNVIIGANGAGKSNLLAFFSMVQAMMTGKFQSYVSRNGGADALLHYGSKNTKFIELSLDFNGRFYDAWLAPSLNNSLTYADVNSFNKVSFFKDSYPVNERFSQKNILFPLVATGGLESNAINLIDDYYWREKDVNIENSYRVMVQSLINTMIHWRVYHFNDTSDSARLKKHSQVNDNIYFRTDGENLAAFLYLLKRIYKKSYLQIVETIKLVAPFFHDFHLRPEPLNEEIIQLEWLENGQNKPFKTFQLSDGTLRFICLATALLQPEEYLPQTIIIDEPELGLNPYSIGILAGLIKVVSKSRQIIITTQSVELLNEFDFEDIVVVDRIGGKSIIKRPDEKEFEFWLKNYSLGELWLKNVFGGRSAL